MAGIPSLHPETDLLNLEEPAGSITTEFRKAEVELYLILKRVLFVYGLYAAVTGALVFSFYGHSDSGSGMSCDRTERFMGESYGPDRAVLIEDEWSAWLARIHIIENAAISLDIMYHAIHPGKSSDILALIFLAADPIIQWAISPRPIPPQRWFWM